MGVIIFAAVCLFIAASAVGCFPDKQKTAGKLSAAACAAMMAAALVSLVAKDGMFGDIIALPCELKAKALLSVAAAVVVGFVFAAAISKGK